MSLENVEATNMVGFLSIRGLIVASDEKKESTLLHPVSYTLKLLCFLSNALKIGVLLSPCVQYISNSPRILKWSSNLSFLLKLLLLYEIYSQANYSVISNALALISSLKIKKQQKINFHCFYR